MKMLLYLVICVISAVQAAPEVPVSHSKVDVRQSGSDFSYSIEHHRSLPLIDRTLILTQPLPNLLTIKSPEHQGAKESFKVAPKDADLKQAAVPTLIYPTIPLVPGYLNYPIVSDGTVYDYAPVIATTK